MPKLKKPKPPTRTKRKVASVSPTRAQHKLSRTEQSPGDVDRVPTGLRSMDIAIGGGLPRRVLTEIAGYTFVGKSTVAYYLAGIVNPKGRILICPTEIVDPAYVEVATAQAGHVGKIWYPPMVDKKKVPLETEEVIDAFGDRIRDDEEASAAVLDSIGAISPIGEQEGSVADANMGRRAKIVANFIRKAEGSIVRRRKTPCNVFLTNHLHPNMGMAGSSTVGGKAIEYHCIVQLRLNIETRFDDGSYLDQGTVYKIRFRNNAPNRAVFNIFIKAGVGVHPGLTAIHDCISYGLAEKKDGRIEMKGKSYGYLSKMIDDKWDDEDLFEPFITTVYKEVK